MWSKFKQSRFFAFVSNKYFVTSLVFLVWIVFFDKNNLLDWTNALNNLRSGRAEQRYYQEQIQKTDKQLRELQSDKDSLERFAREQYFFQKDGEDVYIIEDSQNNSNN